MWAILKSIAVEKNGAVAQGRVSAGHACPANPKGQGPRISGRNNKKCGPPMYSPKLRHAMTKFCVVI